MKRVVLTLLLCVLCAHQTVAQAADFPRPASLEPQIQFWTKVFAKYSEHQTVLHDSRYPNKIFMVVDARPLKRKGLSKAEYYRQKHRLVEQAKRQVRVRLERLHQAGNNTAGLSREELRLRGLYANFRSSHKFRNAASRMRAQGGLKERMAKAIVMSGRYLPHMEEIFRQEGMPLRLTRLPFVESSFNLEAYSKVAAAGIWQFMPSSGRIYGLRNNEIVDDRLDPWLATRAAARHLKDDYEMLRDWGLAVTAYNHGRYGVRRAVKSVGSSDIGVIVKRYKGRRFGFASRNFYTSFLAASDVERDYRRYFGDLRREPPLKFEIVRPRHYVAFSTLARLSGLSVDKFAELNPAFHEPVREGKMRVPPQCTIRVPAGQKQQFERRYGSTTSQIMQANGLRSAHRIRIGQVLKIPPRDGASASMVASRSSSSRTVSSAPSRSSSGGTYRVRRGDTLSSIARRHGTSVSALKAANNIRNVHGLQVGQTLRIPGGASGYVSHRVRSGQTLSSIARDYGSSVSAIKSANGLRSSRIRVGQVLKIPRG